MMMLFVQGGCMHENNMHGKEVLGVVKFVPHGSWCPFWALSLCNVKYIIGVVAHTLYVKFFQVL